MWCVRWGLKENPDIHTHLELLLFLRKKIFVFKHHSSKLITSYLTRENMIFLGNHTNKSNEI